MHACVHKSLSTGPEYSLDKGRRVGTGNVIFPEIYYCLLAGWLLVNHRIPVSVDVVHLIRTTKYGSTTCALINKQSELPPSQVIDRIKATREQHYFQCSLLRFTAQFIDHFIMACQMWFSGNWFIFLNRCYPSEQPRQRPPSCISFSLVKHHPRYHVAH